MGPFDSPSMGSYLLPIDSYGLSLTVLELFSWFQRRFRPLVRPSDPDTKDYRFVEQQQKCSPNGDGY